MINTILVSFKQNDFNELPLLDPEVLHVHAPPFVSKEANSNHVIGPAFSRVQRRKSFIKKVCFINLLKIKVERKIWANYWV